MPVLPQSIADLVAEDHVPRPATADDGSEHMLFWNGANVRSVLLADWPAAAQGEIDEGQKRAAQRAQFQADARAHIGKQAKSLTLPEIRDLLLLYLERDGLIDSDGNITERRPTA